MRSLLLVTLLVGLTGLGCSGESGLQCGPGTHEDNGYCVPDDNKPDTTTPADTADVTPPVPDDGQSEPDGADVPALDTRDVEIVVDAEEPDILPSDADVPDEEDVPAPEDAAVPTELPPTPDSADSGPVADTSETTEPTPFNCDGLAVCDDFESSTVGSGPDPAAWQVVSPICSGDGTIVVDDAFAHSGSRSLRVKSSGGYCNHVFASPTASIGPVDQPLYGRFYVRFGTALGMEHITFVAMKDQVDGKDLRMGGQNEILMWNRELGDATLPELSPVGMSKSVKPAANEWICIEFVVDGVAGTLSTWMDGVLVEGLVIDGEGTPDVDKQWLNMAWNPELVDARFGWESYGGVPMTLWYDDIVLSQSPIGCAD